MKETLIIDDDVPAALEQFRRDRNATLEEVVNEALRRGLREMQAQPSRANHLQRRQWIAARR